MKTETKSKRKKTPPDSSFTLINDNLRQCNTCKIFIRGKLSHFGRHLKVHNKMRRKYACPICPKLFSRKDYTKKHVRTVHGEEISEFNKVTVPAPQVADIKPWIRPFESTPRIRLITEDKKISPPERPTTDLLLEMTRLQEPISPLTSPSPRTYNHPSLSPEVCHSDTTVCMDEKTIWTDTEIFVYSVYGLL